MKKCAAEGCTNYFTTDRWGIINAKGDGWFFQRNGTAWCPSDIPTHLAEWRYARKGIAVSNNNAQEPLPKGPTGMWETRGGDPKPTPSEQKSDTPKDQK